MQELFTQKSKYKALQQMLLESDICVAVECGELSEIEAAKILRCEIFKLRALKWDAVSRVIKNHTGVENADNNPSV